MSDYNQTFGYTQNDGCVDANNNVVGTEDNHAFGFEPDLEKLPIQPSCDDRKKGFNCKTANFIQNFNWLGNAWEKTLHAVKTKVDNFIILTVGLDNQIPFVNDTEDNLEYKETITFDPTQDELNVEHITTNLSVPTSEEFGAEADTQGTNNSLAAGYRAISTDRSVSLGANSESEATAVAVGEKSIALLNSVSIGFSAQSLTDQATTVGYLAKTTGIRAIAIGNSAKAEAHSTTVGEGADSYNQGVTIGSRSESLNASVALGTNSIADAQGIAIGWRAKTIASYCIALGRDAIAGVLAAREFVASNVTHGYFGLDGVERANNLPTIGNFYLRTSGGLGTDLGGDNLHLQGGSSTGAGEGGKLFLGTSQAGATGTSRRNQVDMWSVNPDNSLESLIDGAPLILRSANGVRVSITTDDLGTITGTVI